MPKKPPLLLLLSLLVACGSSGGEQENNANNTSPDDSIIEAPTNTPAPCLIEQDSSLPSLALAQASPRETFLLVGDTAPESIQLDYQSANPASVQGLELLFGPMPESEVGADQDSERLTEPCPAELSLERLRDRSSDAILSMTVLTDEPGGQREGRLTLSTGSRTLEVPLPAGVDLDSAEPWYLLWEPIIGEPRLLIQPIPQDAGASVTLRGLPARSGMVSLIRTSVLEQGPGGVLYAPGGFSAGWRDLLPSRWYVAIDNVTRDTLAVLHPVKDSVGPYLQLQLEDADELTLEYQEGEATYWSFFATSTSASATLQIPCDTRYTLSTPDFGSAKATLEDREEPFMLLPGSSVAFETVCEDAPNTRSLELELTAESTRLPRATLGGQR